MNLHLEGCILQRNGMRVRVRVLVLVGGIETLFQMTIVHPEPFLIVLTHKQFPLDNGTMTLLDFQTPLLKGLYGIVIPCDAFHIGIDFQIRIEIQIDG